MMRISVYCVILTLLLVVYRILSGHERKLAQIVVRQIDSMLYVFDKIVYQNHKKIFDYTTTKPLLFHNQQKFFTSATDYDGILPSMIQDVQYISSLTHSSPLSDSDTQEILNTHTTRQNIHTFKKKIYIIIIILTLGVGKIFLG